MWMGVAPRGGIVASIGEAAGEDGKSGGLLETHGTPGAASGRSYRARRAGEGLGSWTGGEPNKSQGHSQEGIERGDPDSTATTL